MQDRNVIRTARLMRNTIWELVPAGEDLFALKSASEWQSKGKWLSVSADDGETVTFNRTIG